MNTPSKILFAIKRKTIAVVIGLSFAIFSTTPTRATPIVGGRIFVQNTGHVITTFVGSDAGFDDLLLLASPPNNLGVIFEGHVSPPGSMVDLGVFNAGTELIFELNNQNGGIFFTGPANRNPDNIAHAIVDDQFGPGQTFVGFEDAFGGGDFDYNDIQFRFSNVTSAVPDGGSTAMLLGSTVLVLIFLRRFAQR
jgi:uncharacterized protein DUF4114/protein with PEP-CTERM/exosortase system signal